MLKSHKECLSTTTVQQAINLKCFTKTYPGVLQSLGRPGHLNPTHIKVAEHHGRGHIVPFEGESGERTLSAATFDACPCRFSMSFLFFTLPVLACQAKTTHTACSTTDGSTHSRAAYEIMDWACLLTVLHTIMDLNSEPLVDSGDCAGIS